MGRTVPTVPANKVNKNKMANIKNLEMWKDICNDTRISVTSSLFGLRTTATYQPTGSTIDVAAIEYAPADGERLKRILDTPREKMAAAIGDFRPKAAINGNYMAEVCTARDGSFLALQLFQFQRMGYEAVTGVLTFEGDDARCVKQLF